MNVFVELLEENLVLLTLTHMDGYTIKQLRALCWVFLVYVQLIKSFISVK